MIPAVTRGLSPVRRVLDNGVVVIAQRNSAAPALAINATFVAGSFRDPDPLPGLAYLASLSIDRGTARLSGDAIAETLDERGVSLRVSASRHAFSLSCACLTGDFAEIAALIGEVGRRPTFPHAEVEKRRAEAITAVQQDADSTAFRSVEALHEVLYGNGHPYARPPRGTIQSLGAIGRDDLVEFHRRHMVPSALRVVVAGDLEPTAAIDVVARQFSDWIGPAAEPEIVPASRVSARRGTRWVAMPGKSQSDISYGFVALRRLDPRYYAYWLLNNVLGQFGLGGRLADNIRERQGMAYYAFSSLEATVGEGPLVVRAGVDPANVARTIEAIDAEVRALRRDGPTETELEESRAALVGSIPRMLETNEGIAEFLQTAEHFGLGLDHDQRLPGLLAQVTLDDVGRAAAELLDVERAAVAVAGPHEADAAP